MTTKPTEGRAVVSAAGEILIAGTLVKPALFDGETIIPVTIIPTADLVREAARVLLGWMHGYGEGMDDQLRALADAMQADAKDAGSTVDAMIRLASLERALRALAEVKGWPARDPIKEAAMVLLEAESDVTEGAIQAACDAADIHPMKAMRALVAALRSLAGQGGE